MARPGTEFGGDFSPEELELAQSLRARQGSECPSPDLLRATGEHALPDDLQQRIEAHLAGCETCAALLEDLRYLNPAAPNAEQLRRMRERIPAPRKGFWSGWARPVPLFATLAAIAVVTWMARSFFVQRSAKTRAVQSQTAQPSPQPKVIEIAIAKAPVTIPGDIALAWRGKTKARYPSLAEWTSALEPYKQGDFSQAATRLADITRKYPKFGDGYFYLGVSDLMRKEDQAAVSALEAALKYIAEERRSEAAWYLGAAYARLGKTVEAASRFQQLCESHSDYAQQACQNLEQVKSAR